MTAERCQRLVVVAGRPDPVLESSLAFVGLQVVHTTGDVTVWAPIEWDLSGLVADSGSDAPAASAVCDDLAWDGAAYPYFEPMEDNHD